MTAIWCKPAIASRRPSRTAGNASQLPSRGLGEASLAEVKRLHRTLGEIARQPARTARGVRAKAVALRCLLQSGEADALHDDASAPDRLAWSLVQDLLALMPSVSRLRTPDERHPILSA